MNVRQKIGLGIVTPLFVFAVGHTAMSKINQQQKQKEHEYAEKKANWDALNKMSLAKDAEFKAKLNMDSVEMSSEQAKELIDLIQKPVNMQKPENKELSQKVTNDIMKYLKEE